MSLLSKLFGGSSAPLQPTATEHAGFTITPEPAKADGGYRIGATITKGDKSHTLIRADVISDHDAAIEASILKAKQVIDQQGARLFD